MVDFTNFGQAWQKRGDELRRQRLEIADAFQQFKKNNPYASLEEFQDYIDDISGGSNYLRGGAPSSWVLEGIAKTNKENKARDDQRKRIEAMADKLRIGGQVSALADQYILQSDGSQAGIDKARDSFIESLGGNKEDYWTPQLDNAFSTQNYGRLRFDQIAGITPQVIERIDAAGGNLDDATKSNILQTFNITDTELSNIVANQKTKKDRETAEWVLGNQSNLLGLAKEYISGGATQEDLKAMMNDNPLLKNTGYSLNDSTIASLFARATEEKKRADDDRELQLNEKYDSDYEDAVTRLMPQLTALVVTNPDTATTVNQIIEYLHNNITPEAFNRKFGVDKATFLNDPNKANSPIIKSIMERAYATVEANQQQGYGQDVDALSVARVEKGKEFREKNIETGRNSLGSVGASIAVTDYLGPMQIQIINSIMASEEFAEATEESKDNPAVAIQFVKNHPDYQRVRMGLSEAAQDSFARTHPVPLETQGFSQWQTNINSEITDDLAKMDNYLTAIENEPDPTKQQEALEKIILETTNVMAGYRNDIRRAGANTIKWLDFSQGGWDTQAVEGIVTNLQQKLEEVRNRANEIRDNITYNQTNQEELNLSVRKEGFGVPEIFGQEKINVGGKNYWVYIPNPQKDDPNIHPRSRRALPDFILNPEIPRSSINPNLPRGINQSEIRDWMLEQTNPQ